MLQNALVSGGKSNVGAMVSILKNHCVADDELPQTSVAVHVLINIAGMPRHESILALSEKVINGVASHPSVTSGGVWGIVSAQLRCMESSVIRMSGGKVSSTEKIAVSETVF